MTNDLKKAAPRQIPFKQLDFVPRFAHGDQAQVTEVSGPTDGTKLGSGFARFSNANIPWTVQYDEVLLVLEGSVSIKTDKTTLVATAKDCIWLPKGTSLHYQSQSALVFYAIEPSNWASES